MKTFNLSEAEIHELWLAHRREKNKRAADRIKAVYSLAIGHSISQVASILMIDESTLRHYRDTYMKGGIPALIKTDYKGSLCKLSEEALSALRLELSSRIHLTTTSVIDFVKRRFSLCYSVSGMRDLLHRQGYEYKKPKLVPGSPDIDAQELFASQYEDFFITKAPDVEILFLDATHLEHNTQAAYGWIKKGETKRLPTNSGRGRLNLHGAINAETHQVTIIESERINADSTITLLSAIEQAYPGAKEIHVILDNARYHYSDKVKAFIENTKINLVFLPVYSPNLNLIERLWRFFKKKVSYNKYYKNLKDFRLACIEFFSNISYYQKELSSLMSGGFELY